MNNIVLTTGESLPTEPSLGAMLLFRKETGREATEANLASLEDVSALLWANTKAACDVAGIEFRYDVQQFANRVSPQALSEWTRAQFSPPAEGERPDERPSKKKRSASTSC